MISCFRCCDSNKDSKFSISLSIRADNDLNTTILQNSAKTINLYSPFVSVGNLNTTHQRINMQPFPKSLRPNFDTKSISPSQERLFTSEREVLTRNPSSNYDGQLGAPSSRHYEVLSKQNSSASPYSCPTSSSTLSYTMHNQTAHSSQGAVPTSPSGAPGPVNIGPKQLSKLKRFLTTVHTFATDISTEIGDRVKNLILTLVVSVAAHVAVFNKIHTCSNQ